MPEAADVAAENGASVIKDHTRQVFGSYTHTPLTDSHFVDPSRPAPIDIQTDDENSENSANDRRDVNFFAPIRLEAQDTVVFRACPLVQI